MQTRSHQLFIDMHAGIAGDMFLGALLDLEKDAKKQAALIEKLKTELQTLMPDSPINLTLETVTKHSIRGTHIKFDTPEDDWHNTHEHSHEHSHDDTSEQPKTAKDSKKKSSKTQTDTKPHTHKKIHRTFKDISLLIEKSSFSPTVRERAYQVFKLLAHGEANVHNTSIEKIHFHEVGSLDAICEVVGVCLLLEAFQIETLIASPLMLGRGTVRCAHGNMPVPVPAVTEMIALKQAPFKRVAEETGELTTPTGAALVLALAEFREVGTTKKQTLSQVGWGSGTKDFKQFPNMVRLMLLMPEESAIPNFTQGQPTHQETDEIIEIKTSLDDVTGENLAVLMDKLLKAGALDIHFEQVIMKKSRPGIVLNVITSPDKLHTLGGIILTNSPAIGYRYHYMHRHKITRKQEYVMLDGLRLALKVSVTARGKTRVKVEDSSVREALEKLPYSYEELTYRVKQIYHKNISNPS